MLAELLLVFLLPALQVAAPGGERVGPEQYEAGAQEGDQVVRRVGDLEIRASDVFHLLDLAVPGQTSDAIDELVLMAAVQLEARREGVDVDAKALDDQVDRTLAEQRTRFAVEVSSEMTLDEFVAERHGWDPEGFRAVVRKGVLGSLLLDRVVRLNTWRSTRDELQIILVKDAALAQEIADKVVDGASFAVLAKNHSEHPSAAEGGFMPPLPTDISVPLVDGRATLSPGEMLGPAPITLNGTDYWRLVLLIDRVEGSRASWKELRAVIEADLAERPIHPDELTLFEAGLADRYRVSGPGSPP